MRARQYLLQDDKEKLVDQILSLDEENEKLRKENELLRQENERLKEKVSNKKDKFPPKRSDRQSKPPNQWGQKAGHPGSTRPKPEHIDREVEQSLKCCPGCHRRLGKPTETIEHIQEDIIPARVEVTRFLHHRYWCNHCDKIWTAPYAPDEIPHGYLGPRALATMVWLKYHLALPGNKIKDLFSDLCGLKVSEGAIAQALHRLSEYLKVESTHILKVLRRARRKNADETGWKINGVSHWLWSFVHPEWAYFHIHKSRGSKVPKELLGNPYRGILISDFFSAYNKLSGRKQKCLVHLKRDIRNARGSDPPLDFRKPDKKFKRLLADAERLADRRGSLPPLVYARSVARLKRRLYEFGCCCYPNKFWEKISHRVFKHHKELFTFLDVPNLPSDNNAAERAIRPHVIIRNRSFQNRTDKGAQAHGTLTSLVQTLHLQKRDAVPALAQAYLHHRQGSPNLSLFSSVG